MLATCYFCWIAAAVIEQFAECTQVNFSPCLVQKRTASQNEQLTFEKSLKNVYSFDLSKVCHLVDIPITSKIKCVCLNIISMFRLGTKGQTADH